MKTRYQLKAGDCLKYGISPPNHFLLSSKILYFDMLGLTMCYTNLALGNKEN